MNVRVRSDARSLSPVTNYGTIAQQDAVHVKKLTKAEMVEFFNDYFSPSSLTRARISVHLKAHGASELDAKIVNLLEQSGLKDVPQEKRQSVDLLQGYLESKKLLASGKLEKIIEEIKKMGLSQGTSSEAANGTTGGFSAVDTVREITDVRHHRAGLLASSGARPVRQISEFEELDAKL